MFSTWSDSWYGRCRCRKLQAPVDLPRPPRTPASAGSPAASPSRAAPSPSASAGHCSFGSGRAIFSLPERPPGWDRASAPESSIDNQDRPFRYFFNRGPQRIALVLGLGRATIRERAARGESPAAIAVRFGIPRFLRRGCAGARFSTRPAPLSRQPKSLGGQLWTCNARRCSGECLKATSPSSRNFPVPTPKAPSLEEARTNLREAVALVVEANRVMARKDAGGGAVIREPITVTA